MLRSWPFPASRTTSPSRAIPIARPIASRRSSIDPEGLAVPRTGDAGAVRDRLVDRARVLEPRVLVGHHHEVGELGRDTAHRCALGGIALPRRAEHDDEPARSERAEDLEHLAQRVGRVRVVDDDGERLAGIDPLHPARHAGRVRAAPTRRDATSSPSASIAPKRGQRIRDVEPARQADADVAMPARRLEMESRAGRVRLQVAGAQVGGNVDAVGDDAIARSLAEVVEARVIGIEHGDRRLLDQARLRRSIVVERAVELEMLAGHRRHHARRRSGSCASVPAPARARSPP